MVFLSGLSSSLCGSQQNIKTFASWTFSMAGSCLKINFLLFLIATLPIKVAEHSFQEPIPNSPLLLSYLSFGTHFLQESRLTTEEFILAFWLRCELLPWQRG